MSQEPLSRRDALRMSSGLVLLGCTAPSPTAAPSAAPSPSPAPPPAAPALRCVETHDNIEGPYYRAQAPRRSVLVEPGMRGTPLEIAGRVTGLDCARGLAGVELDFWQATHEGHYDNDGTMADAAGRFLLRGRLETAADGTYRVQTIVPGRYLNGRQYRPAHVHVKVRAPGFAPLTTQLYFPDDPYNDIDPYIHRSLVMGIERASSGLRGRFDFVLRRA